MHGPNLNRDWVGLRVKLKREARNAMGVLAAGTTGTIASYSSRDRIWFDADKCGSCRCGLMIGGMGREDFTILTPPDAWKDTRGQGRQGRRR
jgi:hypothetical protein